MNAKNTSYGAGKGTVAGNHHGLGFPLATIRQLLGIPRREAKPNPGPPEPSGSGATTIARVRNYSKSSYTLRYAVIKCEFRLR